MQTDLVLVGPGSDTQWSMSECVARYDLHLRGLRPQRVCRLVLCHPTGSHRQGSADEEAYESRRVRRHLTRRNVSTSRRIHLQMLIIAVAPQQPSSVSHTRRHLNHTRAISSTVPPTSPSGPPLKLAWASLPAASQLSNHS